VLEGMIEINSEKIFGSIFRFDFFNNNVFISSVNTSALLNIFTQLFFLINFPEYLHLP